MKSRGHNTLKIKLLFIFFTVILISIVGFLIYDNVFNIKSKPEFTQEAWSQKNSEIKEIVTESEKLKPLYNERFGISNNQKIIGALPESANKNGCNSLKVWEKLENRDYSPLNGKKVIFLTFDDGPSSKNTRKILNILKDYDVKATFFVKGCMVDENPEILKEIYNEGHAIANHTFSHNYRILYPKNSLNFDNFKKEIDKTENSIKKVLGENFRTRVIRCPGGFNSWNNMTPLYDYLKKEGMASIDWNILNGDAKGKEKNANELFRYLISKCKAYDTIVALMHDTDDKNETVKMLPKSIEHFKNKDFKFKILI